MSSMLGPVALGEEHASQFLRSAGVVDVRPYSEQTSRLVDEEIRKLTLEALDRARDVLRRNRDKVQALAARLLATEVLEEEDIRNILGPKVTREKPGPREAEETEVQVRPGEPWPQRL